MKKLILTFAVLLAIELTNSSYIQAGCKGQLQSCLAPYGIHVTGNNSGGITVILTAGNKGGADNTVAVLACIDEYNVCKIGFPDSPTLFVTYPPLTKARLI